jgi:hypothetical protein
MLAMVVGSLVGISPYVKHVQRCSIYAGWRTIEGAESNTTIYSDDDRYRGVKNLRTLILMNEDDMRDRGFSKFDLIDVKSFAKDGSMRE